MRDMFDGQSSKKNSVINEVQQLTKDMLKAAAEICQRHGIRYYVVEGTLLGTVRHKGFVPWDDDVDIAVPMSDLDRFVGFCREELPEDYYIEGAYEDGRSGADLGLTRIYHKNYSVIDVSGRKMPLFIDVPALIGMPNSAAARSAYYSILLLRRAMPKICRPETIQTNYWRNQSHFRKFIIWLVQKIPFGKVFPYEKQVKKLKKCVSRYLYNKSDYVMLYPSAYGKKEILKKDYYGEGIEGVFEGISVCMPCDYEKVLTQLYGDYMTPPPEEKRVGSHIKELFANQDR